jgi:hypothetical protein
VSDHSGAMGYESEDEMDGLEGVAVTIGEEQSEFMGKNAEETELKLKRVYQPGKESCGVVFLPKGKRSAFMPGERYFLFRYENMRHDLGGMEWSKRLEDVFPGGSRWYGNIRFGNNASTALLLLDFGGVPGKKRVQFSGQAVASFAVEERAPFISCPSRNLSCYSRSAAAEMLNKFVWLWQQKICEGAVNGDIIGSVHVEEVCG